MPDTLCYHLKYTPSGIDLYITLLPRRTETVRIDRKSPVPLYYQLAESLRERIITGQLPPGAQLPSERELSEEAGISRMTARQGLAYLEREGLLEVKPGVGTFVVAPKLTHEPLHLLGFTEEIIRQGGAPSSQVLEQAITVPTPRVSDGLRLARQARVVKIARLRLSQGLPLLLETVYLPADLCPGLEAADLTGRSLYAILAQQYRLQLARAQQTIEATVANAYESELLGVEPGASMLLLEGVTYAADERPVEYFKAIYRGDRFKFAIQSRHNGVENIENATVIHQAEVVR
jgi:GntR family transcriptional regulator